VPESDYPLIMQTQKRGTVSFYYGPENHLDWYIPELYVRQGIPIPYMPNIKISDAYFHGIESTDEGEK
jgi:hypothetical protein